MRQLPPLTGAPTTTPQPGAITPAPGSADDFLAAMTEALKQPVPQAAANTVMPAPTQAAAQQTPRPIGFTASEAQPAPAEPGTRAAAASPVSRHAVGPAMPVLTAAPASAEQGSIAPEPKQAAAEQGPAVTPRLAQPAQVPGADAITDGHPSPVIPTKERATPVTAAPSPEVVAENAEAPRVHTPEPAPEASAVPALDTPVAPQIVPAVPSSAPNPETPRPAAGSGPRADLSEPPMETPAPRAAASEPADPAVAEPAVLTPHTPAPAPAAETVRATPAATHTLTAAPAEATPQVIQAPVNEQGTAPKLEHTATETQSPQPAGTVAAAPAPPMDPRAAAPAPGAQASGMPAVPVAPKATAAPSDRHQHAAAPRQAEEAPVATAASGVAKTDTPAATVAPAMPLPSLVATDPVPAQRTQPGPVSAPAAPVTFTPVLPAPGGIERVAPILAAAVTSGFVPASYPVVQRPPAPVSERAVTETPASSQAASPVPFIAPAPQAPATTAVQAPTPFAPASQPALQTQLSKPLFTMATSAAGEHIMTVRVSPDELGPVTVRAHIGADGIRMELVASTDAGREAIRAILPDLKRDLSGQGMDARLDLSSGNQQQGSTPEGRGDRASARHEPEQRQRHQQQEQEQPPAENRRMYTQGPSLDVMA